MRPISTKPEADDVARWTDHYFLKTRQAVGRFGDKTVTYTVSYNGVPAVKVGREFLLERD